MTGQKEEAAHSALRNLLYPVCADQTPHFQGACLHRNPSRSSLGETLNRTLEAASSESRDGIPDLLHGESILIQRGGSIQAPAEEDSQVPCVVDVARRSAVAQVDEHELHSIVIGSCWRGPMEDDVVLIDVAVLDVGLREGEYSPSEVAEMTLGHWDDGTKGSESDGLETISGKGENQADKEAHSCTWSRNDDDGMDGDDVVAKTDLLFQLLIGELPVPANKNVELLPLDDLVLQRDKVGSVTLSLRSLEDATLSIPDASVGGKTIVVSMKNLGEGRDGKSIRRRGVVGRPVDCVVARVVVAVLDGPETRVMRRRSRPGASRADP